MKRILLLLIIGIFAVAVPSRPATNGVTAATIGDEVSISYQMGNKTFHECQVQSAVFYNYSYVAARYTYMMENDGLSQNINVYKDNASEISFKAVFKILSPYTDLSKIYFDWRAKAQDGTPETWSATIIIYKADGSTTASTASHDTWTTGSTALSSAHIVDGYIHGIISIQSVDNDADQSAVYTWIDLLVFEYNPVIETAISSVDYWSDGKERQQVDFTCFDYNVEATLTPPGDWTFHNVNPNCTRSGWIFSNTVPVTYTVTANTTDYYTITTLWMTFLRADGFLIPWGTFICYVNSQQAPQAYVEIKTASTTANITLVDDWGNVVYQNTSYNLNATGNTYLRESLNVFQLHLDNQQERACYAIVSRNGYSRRYPNIGSGRSFTILVYTGTYTVDWYRAENGHFLESEEIVVVSSDETSSTSYEKPDIDINVPIIPVPVVPPFLIIIAAIGGILLLLISVATYFRSGKQKAAVVTAYPTRQPSYRSPRTQVLDERGEVAQARARIAQKRQALAKSRKRTTR